MRCNKIFSKVPATAIFFVVIVFSTLTFTASTFDQSEGMNHTMQNNEESANQTIQNTNQSANETGEAILLHKKNVTDLSSNLTEIAKKLAKSIGEGMNHTMKTIEESANQTLQNTNESANETGEPILLHKKNVTDLSSNLTEIAKKLAKSIGEGMNHTMQNNEESANQTIQNTNQSANETGEAILLHKKNVTDLGSNLTEIAKKLAKSIDEGIKNLSQ